MLNRIIRFFLENRLITILLFVAFILLGTVYAPFNWHSGLLPRDPVPVDAIPDIGDNQQIVATVITSYSIHYTKLYELV